MVEDKEIEDFLEHFGVKGMKWGVRKRRDEKARARLFGKKEQQGMSGKKKAAIAVGVVGAGALVAGAIIARNRGVKVQQLSQLDEVKASLKRSADSFKALSNRRTSAPFAKPGVIRVGGAIPMPPAGNSVLRTSGKTLIRDVPKSPQMKISDLPPGLRERAASAVRNARPPISPAELRKLRMTS